MSNGTFETNLLKTVSAEMYFLAQLTVAREMYGKSYFALGITERAVVDQTVLASVSALYQLLTPETLKQLVAQPSQPAGFQPQAPPEKPGPGH